MKTTDLKFRVWYPFEKRFIHFDLHEGVPSGYYGGFAEPEMFTGLTDTAGIEIYEGDIVRCIRKDNIFGNEDIIQNRRVTIQYSSSMHTYESGGPDGSIEYQQPQIIGHIHQTK